MPRRRVPARRTCRCRRSPVPRAAAAGRCATWAGGRAPARAVSFAEHLSQLAELRAAGELQEQLLETGVARLVLAPHVVDAARGDDLAVLDDRDLIAHRFGDFECVRAHHHGTAALDKLAKNVLE